MNIEALDCMEVMSEVYRTMEGLAKQRGIQFTADTSAVPARVLADRGRLIQVLLNLLSNAIKYNIDGGWILMAASVHEGKVRFFIRDTGRGIRLEFQCHVFEPFNRLGAEQGPQEGTGIGLAICRRLVRRMGGDIGFESVEGAGSKFWFDLPLALADTAATPTSQPTLSAVSGEAPFKILYIEDRVPAVELMRGIIGGVENSEFFDVQTMHDAFDILPSVKPDLVITDIHLPDGTGFEVLDHMRADPETEHTPVIALTADAMPVNMHRMALHQFDHIVTMPYSVPEMMNLVRTTLRAA